MKQGKTLQELAKALDNQQTRKQDYVGDTRKMQLISTEAHTSSLHLHGEDILCFDVTEHTHRQIAQRLKIPAKYYDRLRADHPSILDMNVNSLFCEESERRMIRTLDGSARAFLSDRYRPLDNYDLAQAVLPVLGDVPDIKIESCELTEKRMYIKALFPRIETEVKKGDVVQSGVVISNSEIGAGALTVEPLVFRLECTNGMISKDYSQRKAHLGRAADEGERAFEFYRDETLQADDKALWLKIQDTVRASVNETNFQKIVEAMRRSTHMLIEADPIKVVERVQSHYRLDDSESGNVLRHLISGSDLSAYGVLNAITRTAQDVSDYDRATELERVGGQIIELKPNEWQQLAA